MLLDDVAKYKNYIYLNPYLYNAGRRVCVCGLMFDLN